MSKYTEEAEKLLPKKNPPTEASKRGGSFAEQVGINQTIDDCTPAFIKLLEELDNLKVNLFKKSTEAQKLHKLIIDIKKQMSRGDEVRVIEIKDVLKTYYFTEWKDDDDCVNTLLPKIQYIVRGGFKKEVSVEGIEQIARVVLVGKGIEVKSVKKVSSDEVLTFIDKYLHEIAQAITDYLKGE